MKLEHEDDCTGNILDILEQLTLTIMEMNKNHNRDMNRIINLFSCNINKETSDDILRDIKEKADNADSYDKINYTNIPKCQMRIDMMRKLCGLMDNFYNVQFPIAEGEEPQFNHTVTHEIGNDLSSLMEHINEMQMTLDEYSEQMSKYEATHQKDSGNDNN